MKIYILSLALLCTLPIGTLNADAPDPCYVKIAQATRSTWATILGIKPSKVSIDPFTVNSTRKRYENDIWAEVTATYKRYVAVFSVEAVQIEDTDDCTITKVGRKN